MWKLLLNRWHTPPPALGVPPTYWQLRRMCRWQAYRLRLLARASNATTVQQRARTQAEWIANVLRHHPLRDDLQRTVQQSADLLQALAPSTLPPESS